MSTNKQLDLEMQKSWCTAGCNQLLTPEEFKTHKCVLRDAEDKKSRGISVMTATPRDIQFVKEHSKKKDQRLVGETKQAASNPAATPAVEQKPPSPQFYVGMETYDLIDNMMHQASAQTQNTENGTETADERNRVPSLHPWIETPDRSSTELIAFILRQYERCYLSFSEGKSEEYKQVCKIRPQFKYPPDLAPRQPFRNGIGPQGGRNEKRSYSGDIILRTPENLEELKVFDRFGHFALPGSRYREERLKFESKNNARIRISDTRLLLFLMDRYPEKVYLDAQARVPNYPTARRYRPYDPEGAKLRREENKKQKAAELEGVK
ncbi:MAG: hypothetical protein WA817_09790 [Candidatus Acidiferrum sp.]